MVKILIGHRENLADHFNQVQERLEEIGYQVNQKIFKDIFPEDIEDFEVYIFVLDEELLSFEDSKLIDSLDNYQRKIKEKHPESLFIIYGLTPQRISNRELFTKINYFQNILTPDFTVNRFEQIISSYIGRKLALEKQKEEIRKTAAEYVQETITEIKQKEKSLEKAAKNWYMTGYVSLVLGVILALAFTFISYNSSQNWQDILIWGIKAAVILILFISSSKYAFNLGKTFMNEALKNADRTHAINFGKFYLQLFGDSVTPNDMKEIFRDWNLDKPSAFVNLKTEEYDPKIIEIVMKTIETVKGK